MNRLLSAILLMAMAFPALAKEISPEEALLRARSTSARIAAKGTSQTSPSLVHTAISTQGTPTLYVFNSAPGQGYMILSADDAAVPVLGYSDSGSFNSQNIPPQMEWWLAEYSRQIEYARANNLAPYSPSRSISRAGERQPIEPMLKTKWDQVAPYNAQCPLDGSERTWTGCVATSMAQVMKYWEYPEKGTGSITYSIESIEKKVTMNFASKAFEWDNMIDTYVENSYTQEQADAVAYLMKACGYSVKMQYSLSASGALAMNVGRALVKYFSYDPNTFYTLRQYYSSEQWDAMMYENLLNVGPVIYGGGSSLGGGHSFVCDGYNGDGMYHFNWGWSGMSDGYFSLDALNPASLGTGGGTGGGYNFTQDAVFGIQPPTGEPEIERPDFLTQTGELSGSVTDNVLSFSLVNVADGRWINYNPFSIRLKFGAMFYPQGSDAEPLYHDVADLRMSLDAGYGVSPQVLGAKVDLSKLSLADGTYKVVCGYVPVASNTPSAPTDGTGFLEMRPTYGLPNYVILKVADGKYSIENALLEPLKIKGEIIGDLFYGALTTVKVTVENPSDVERSSGFAPVFLFKGSPLLLGESIYLTIPPKSTVTRQWSTSLQQYVQFIDPYLDTDITFTFFDEMNFQFYTEAFSEVVQLKPNPGKPQVRLSKPIAVEGSYKDGRVVVISDPNSFTVTGELRLTSGFFNYPFAICLCAPATQEQVEIVASASQMMNLTLGSSETDRCTFSLTLSYPQADPEQTYYLIAAYQGAGGLEQIGSIVTVRFDNSSGIETPMAGEGITITPTTTGATVNADSEIAAVEAYDITGRRIGADVVLNGNSASLHIAANGFCIVKVTLADGESQAFKLKL